MDDHRPSLAQLAQLAALAARGELCVLTGAGISTASGIPDYRGPETAQRARNPVQYRDFLRSAAARARYWRRSAAGYPRIAAALPNRSHALLTELAQRGLLTGLITQNVDGLHVRAGHPEHLELHGALREVVCLDCGAVSSRDTLQALLRSWQPGERDLDDAPAPDGDAELSLADDLTFPEVTCADCGGLLKPNVVFFGENVPPARVSQALLWLDQARALLVLGSSLTVYSGLRFVRRAAARALPVAIVNLGPTRGDPDATIKLDASVGATLSMLAEALP